MKYQNDLRPMRAFIALLARTLQELVAKKKSYFFRAIRFSYGI